MSLYEGSACDMISEGVELKKTQEIILIGAGGHSMPVVDTVSMISQLWNYMNLRIPRQQIIGFIDTEKTGEWLGYPILGREIEDIPDYQEYWYHVSIGSIKAREKYYKSIKSLGLRFATIISPGAAISHSSIIGDGTFIGMNCYVGAHVEIGENCLINTGAVLEHCTIVGKNCNISTNATLNGDVVVGNGVHFGSGAISNGQIYIREHAIVGSGSVVLNDVEAYSTVVGVPARIIKERGVEV